MTCLFATDDDTGLQPSLLTRPARTDGHNNPPAEPLRVGKVHNAHQGPKVGRLSWKILYRKTRKQARSSSTCLNSQQRAL